MFISDSTVEVSPNFSHYLDMVSKDTERTRATLYLLILATIAIFGILRSSDKPAWEDARLSFYQKAYVCWNDPNGDNTCPKFIKTSELNLPLKSTFKTSDDIDNDERIRELKEQIDDHLKRHVESHTIQLPIIGITFDTNDLGVVSGGALVILLFIMRLFDPSDRQSATCPKEIWL